MHTSKKRNQFTYSSIIFWIILHVRFTITFQSCFSDYQTSNKKLLETTTKQFKRSLDQLIKTLTSKQPWYIRCIKPNDYKDPGRYNNNDKNNRNKLRKKIFIFLINICRIFNSANFQIYFIQLRSYRDLKTNPRN